MTNRQAQPKGFGIRIMLGPARVLLPAGETLDLKYDEALDDAANAKTKVLELLKKVDHVVWSYYPSTTEITHDHKKINELLDKLGDHVFEVRPSLYTGQGKSVLVLAESH